MKAQYSKSFVLMALLAAAVTAGCGDVATSSRAPGQLVITRMSATSGQSGVPTTFPQASGPLMSDVATDDGGTFNDFGQVTMRLMLRDPGIPGVPAAPSGMNEVTITRYRVAYRRADGRNQQGVDVPHTFDGVVTFTVGANETSAIFEVVRHVAKREPPLANLTTDFAVLTTIADVTFYGRDQAGNEISATGSIQVNFANFADLD